VKKSFFFSFSFSFFPHTHTHATFPVRLGVIPDGMLRKHTPARFGLIELCASPEPHPKGSGCRCILKIISYPKTEKKREVLMRRGKGVERRSRGG